MNLVRKILGPDSKYVADLPYTYEARVAVIEGEELTNSYFADTICGLVDYLQAEGIAPAQVRILEIFEGGEDEIPAGLYSRDGETWRHRPEICHTFSEHYPGHIAEGTCSFRDRDRRGFGP